MNAKRRSLFAWLVLLIIASLTLAACSPSAQPPAQPTLDVNAIYTSAALTMQAKAPTQAPALPTATSAPAATAVLPTVAPPTAACTDSAELVSEDPLDNAVFKPGEKITKRWTLKNTGTCVWTNYRFEFDGQAMGANSTTPVNQIAPGQSIDLFAYPVAPAAAGTYKGGATLYNNSGGVVKVTYQGAQYNGVSVQIVVKGAAVGGIANTFLSISQEQGSGAICTAGSTYFVVLQIVSSGATTAQYTIYATDGSGQVPDGIFDGYGSPSVSDSLTFTTAETKTITLRLTGPYSYADTITIRGTVNGSNLPPAVVACH
jgi:hypothetical protein